jgi:3-oxoacyl-[acyl-carrier protein] reductase
MNLDLTNKNALVGGGSKGIGKAVAIELALLGASVTLLARNEQSLLEAIKDLDTSKGQQHHAVSIDMSHTDMLKVLAEALTKDKTYHILVNNTGGPAGGLAIDAQLESFKTAFSQHLIANQVLVQALVPGMKAAGYGRIVNIISTSVKQPIPGLGVSNTIRGAVANWSKTLAGELGKYGITVNNVLPGATATERLDSIINTKSDKTGKSKAELEAEMMAEIPAARFAEPKEIAAAAAFLATPAAAYINGINVPVDGGRTSCL